ncbi:Nuclear export mediator factor NEMF [Fasciola gigantica]|uniref:Nuclear export mediator factor NEMF n=1 Tax=Fasciola gigantica TaxID=46835 RepID=A0A504YME5_FASGI|nr:Nuclear export mediator factor NEMF [Fasciola gigantica]
MINHALSNQMDWRELEARLTEARTRGDSLATHVTELNLQCNQITLRLSDPFANVSQSENSEPNEEMNKTKAIPFPNGDVDVVVDLDLNALNNARKYYDKKRAAVKKEEKTLIASRKALKSAAYKAEQMRKDVKTLVQISKVRKSMCRVCSPYFIFDLPADKEVTDPASTSKPTMPVPPPKTLNEAGTMAIVLSSAWNERVVTSAWWVRADQVSKTAPSGEYMNTGAFMIRGRKNYLPMSNFFYGFGILFKGKKAAKNKLLNRISDKSLNPTERVSTQPDKINEKPKNEPLKRGQKSKLKKIKQKYGEQDEDERQMRMAILQGEGAKLSQHHQRFLQERGNSANAKVPTDTEPDLVTDDQPSSEIGSDSNPETAIGEHLSSDRSATKVVSIPVLDSEGEKDEMVERTLAVARVESDAEEGNLQPGNSKGAEDNWLHLMDTFTGKPCEDDVLLYALPVCGPYSALTNYKFKVKLTPGNAKRGKGVYDLKFFVPLPT